MNAGMNRVTWDMTGGRGRAVEPGEYTITLEVAGGR